MKSTIFINSQSLGGNSFSISIKKYVSEEWEQMYLYSLKNKTTENDSAGMRFPLLIPIFVISLFSWFMKLSHLRGDYVSM